MRGLGFAEGRGRRPRPRQTLNPDCPSPDIMHTTANHSNLSIKSITTHTCTINYENVRSRVYKHGHQGPPPGGGIA